MKLLSLSFLLVCLITVRCEGYLKLAADGSLGLWWDDGNGAELVKSFGASEGQQLIKTYSVSGQEEDVTFKIICTAYGDAPAVELLEAGNFEWDDNRHWINGERATIAGMPVYFVQYSENGWTAGIVGGRQWRLYFDEDGICIFSTPSNWFYFDKEGDIVYGIVPYGGEALRIAAGKLYKGSNPGTYIKISEDGTSFSYTSDQPTMLTEISDDQATIATDSGKIMTITIDTYFSLSGSEPVDAQNSETLDD